MKRGALAFVLLLGLAACARWIRVAPAAPATAAAPVVSVPVVPPAPSRSAEPPTAPTPAVQTPVAPLPPSPATLSGTALAVPLLLRVGLATDLTEVVLPCCDAAVVAELEGESVLVASPIRVEPGAPPRETGAFRVQVAALKDEGQAKGLAATLERSTGERAEAVFDAKTDLYRVRVGQFRDREQATALQTRLAGLGVEPSFVASEGSGDVHAGLRVSQGGRVRLVTGRWLAMNAVGEGGIRVEGRRYRGRVLVYLNDRGLLNVINEIPLESYLRGVVPRELGPKIYDQVEALKAQAVAARTYALKNLDEFSTEGYDICATPRCQVYGGMEDEDPLSDRAISETDGEIVLYDGKPADTLYSSTCGGHTEDVAVVFPLKSAPYLRGVSCIEAGVSQLGGTLRHGTPIAQGLVQRLAPDTGGAGPERLARRLARLAALAGLATHPVRLPSLSRRDVLRALAETFDLDADAELFVAREDTAYLLPEPPAAWTEVELRLAVYLAKTGLLPAAAGAVLTEAEIDGLLQRLAVFFGVLREEEVSFRRIAEGQVTVADKDGERQVPVPAGLATFRMVAGGAPLAADLALLPADKLRLIWHGQDLLAVTQEVLREGAAYDRTSNRSSWTRWRTDGELAASVRTRYPGFELASFVLGRRGRSGRVADIRLLGRDGKTITVEGLAVRWTLDVPDTWFTVRRGTPAGRPPGWLFSGRGFGHGVGVCQVGAYGMALRGHDYRAILHHYYTNVTIGKLPSASSGR